MCKVKTWYAPTPAEENFSLASSDRSGSTWCLLPSPKLRFITGKIMGNYGISPMNGAFHGNLIENWESSIAMFDSW